jgi:hypothetical protein
MTVPNNNGDKPEIPLLWPGGGGGSLPTLFKVTTAPAMKNPMAPIADTVPTVRQFLAAFTVTV